MFLNNVVFIFDKEYFFMFKFLEFFVFNFNGSVWGYNGLYVVIKVVMGVMNDLKFNFNILFLMVFYLVDWLSIG